LWTHFLSPVVKYSSYSKVPGLCHLVMLIWVYLATSFFKNLQCFITVLNISVTLWDVWYFQSVGIVFKLLWEHVMVLVYKNEVKGIKCLVISFHVTEFNYSVLSFTNCVWNKLANFCSNNFDRKLNERCLQIVAAIGCDQKLTEESC
jgi:hypothetical protein